ncbi:MAG TPA: FtsX-like permease family protein [Bryobacteraceae bacterium]|nr:FtsX-like permease family protein [Bryobacteraceae bacterium]
MRLSLRTASRIAWRETRASMTKFLFVVLAVAAGVGALAGVRGFSQSFRATLKDESRTVMAADLTARQFAPATPAQNAPLDDLARKGVEHTLITETISMAASAMVAPGSEAATPALVSIKAVDPAKYPYYGAVKLDPPMALKDALTPDSVAVATDVLLRLNVKVGDQVRIGTSTLRVAAVVLSEPDRMSGSMNVGLRLMMSREAFERTGLMGFGSRAAYRYLFKTEATAPPVAEIRAALKTALPDALVADFRESSPVITRGLDRATTFLSLVSLIAMIVGALGVAMAMHAHLQQRMDNIAVMKSLGAASRDIIGIYAIQTLMLGTVGGIAGVLVGKIVERTFPVLIARFFQMDFQIGWNLDAAVQGIAIGVLTTLLFTLPPLLAIRKVRPALILRRDMPEARPSWRRHWRTRLADALPAIAAGALILTGIGGIAGWLAESPKVGGYFAGGLAGSLILLALLASGLLRLIRVFLKRTPWRIPTLARQGLANLYRQGNQARAILVALGLGVMFTLTVYLVQHSLVAEIVETAPPGMPNVFMIGITPEQVQPLGALISKQPGVLTAPEFAPSVPVQIVSVNGTPFQELGQGEGRRFRGSRSVMFAEDKPSSLKVVQGAWWKKGESQFVLSIEDEAASRLGVGVGDTLTISAAGKEVSARIVALHQVQQMRTGMVNELVFNPPSLAGMPATFYGGVRVKPSQVGALERASYAQFPTVTVINVAEALAIVQQVVDQIAVVIRFLSGFAILAGAIILAASVAGTRFRRVREVVILKTLGATRRSAGRIFSVEFLTLGVVAGLMGALLASVFSSLLLKRLLDAAYSFDLTTTAVTVVLTALLAQASGWLASFRILKQKPLEVLRDE